jgi:hypothetical protein
MMIAGDLVPGRLGQVMARVNQIERMVMARHVLKQTARPVPSWRSGRLIVS